MSLTKEAAEMDRRNQEIKDVAFQKWMSDPMVRMGMSMVPAGENRDALQMLLRSAFDAGFGNGQGALAVDMIQAGGGLKKSPTSLRTGVFP